MVFNQNIFYAQAQLMLRCLPYVLEEDVFALKGGTAINFFLRDMPRLSVDIDLTYLPIAPREQSLSDIATALESIAQKCRHIAGASIQAGKSADSHLTTKLFIRNPEAHIKIEPNLVIRGTVFPTEEHILSPKAQEIFELFFAARTVSIADIFGGKICAALDRQHPRDLYDIVFLFEGEGFTENIRKGFLVYLISHDRPMRELLDPILKDFTAVYESEFQGMAAKNRSYEELREVRERLIRCVKQTLTNSEKTFLLSLKKGEPDWELLGVPGVEDLPAVQWKLRNIRRMDTAKHNEAIECLKRVLNS